MLKFDSEVHRLITVDRRGFFWFFCSDDIIKLMKMDRDCGCVKCHKETVRLIDII